jgi:hypothetical protein
MLGGTMVGASVSLVGLSKLVEASRGPSHVDILAGLTGAIFALSTAFAYLAIRAEQRRGVHRGFELAADIMFALGLFAMASVGLLFALDFI